MPDVLIPVGHHRAAPIPPPPPDDDHLGGEERVRCADDGADVQVVLPVLDRDREVVPAGVQIGDDRVERPVAIAVGDIAPVTVSQQVGVQARVVGPGRRVGTDADLGGVGVVGFVRAVTAQDSPRSASEYAAR